MPQVRGTLVLSYDMEDRGGLGLYEHLYRCIKNDILAGVLDPHDRLPSKRRLAEHLGVSVITVEGAYRQLVAEGFAYALPKRGFYVSELPQSAKSAGQSPAGSSPSKGLHVVAGAHTQPEAPSPAPFADFTRPSLRSGSSAARLWGKALRSALVQEDESVLFSAQPAQGSPRLRRAIASYLRSSRGMEVDPECVVVGAGSQILYGMVPLLARSGAAAGPFPCIALEDPGYPRLYDTYRMLGASTFPISLDDEGMDVDALARCGASVAHVMPSHQFPTGRVMSVSRRYQLLGWASRQPGRLIVEDDYDWEFRLAGRPIPSLQSIDSQGCVVYLSTFSKSLSAALRIAFAVVPPQLVERLQAHAIAGTPAPRELFGLFAGTVSSVDQIALARLLESGDYERHLNRYRKESRDVRDALIAALEAQFPKRDIRIEQADSGLHFVLALRAPSAAAAPEAEAAIARQALALGVRLAPLSSYAAAQGGRAVPQPAPPPDPWARFVMQYDGLEPGLSPNVAQAIHKAWQAELLASEQA